jgi:hypothetical protein
MEYRVQRPARIWIETKVEADSLEQAIELADEKLSNGDFREAEDAFEIYWDSHWIEDEQGKTYNEYGETS